jgi:ElaB/YqjD/DUF883 family membrane-anchored ribosome-binding protein
MNQNTIEQLSEDLRSLADDAHELLGAAGGDVADKAKVIRDRVATALESAEETLDTVNKTVRSGATAADRAIRAKPYHAAGIALAIGILLGLFMRKDK